MSDEFHLFQDENSHHAVAGRTTTVQPNQHLASRTGHESLMPSKTALSDRRALGNITNNGNIHTTSKPQQISVRRSENNGLRSQSSTALADTKQNTAIDNERNTRIEYLVQGGVECSAGPTWEEQQVLQELGSADTLKYAVSAYNNMIQTHVSKLCEDLGEDTSGTEARRMIVRDVMAVQNRESCVDIPNASSLSRKKTSTSELDIYCSDDEDLGSSELLEEQKHILNEQYG